MENSQTPTPAPGGHPQRVEIGSFDAGPAQSVPVHAGPAKSTEEQRARWREKWRSRQARKGRSPGGVAPESVRSPESVGSESAAPADAVAVVPWDSSVLKPLFEQIVPALEKVDVESLKTQAAKISPELVDVVERDAPWNQAAKTTLITTGPDVTAKLLNAVGLGAEHAPEVAFGIAAVSILSGRMILSNKLEQMAERLKPEVKEERK